MKFESVKTVLIIEQYRLSDDSMNKLSIQEIYFSCQTKGDKCNSPAGCHGAKK